MSRVACQPSAGTFSAIVDFVKDLSHVSGIPYRTGATVSMGERTKNKTIYRKGTGGSIIAYMYLMRKVGRVAETNERVVIVNVVLPTI